MKKKGFTLIELLAVIIIMGLIFAFVASNIMKSIDNALDKEYRLLSAMMESAASIYVDETNPSELTTVGGEYCVTLDDLASKGLVSLPILSPYDDEPYPNSTCTYVLNISKDNLYYEFNATQPHFHLELNGENPAAEVCGADDYYLDPGASVVTPAGNSIAVVYGDTFSLATGGENKLTYEIYHGVDLIDTIDRTINVQNDNVPEIVIGDGSASIDVGLNSDFTIPRAVGYDACQTGLEVTSSGTVNTNKKGSYTITYTTENGSGVSASKDLTVNVIRPYPEFVYQTEVIVDHTKVDATLTNFPLTVKFNSENFYFDNARADGKDVRFVDQDYNFLDFEREIHDSINKKAVYHVKVPSISSTKDTKIYALYGNDSLPVSQSFGLVSEDIASLDDALSAGTYDLTNTRLYELTAAEITDGGYIDKVDVTWGYTTDDYLNWHKLEGQLVSDDSWVEIHYNTTNYTAYHTEAFDDLETTYGKIKAIKFTSSYHDGAPSVASIKAGSATIGKYLKQTTKSTEVSIASGDLDPTTSSSTLNLYNTYTYNLSSEEISKGMWIDETTITWGRTGDDYLNWHKLEGQLVSDDSWVEIHSNLDNYTTNHTETFADLKTTYGAIKSLRYTSAYYDAAGSISGIAGSSATLIKKETNYDGGDNPEVVWDDNYIMVQHMGSSLEDSTSNGNDGTNSGTTLVAGEIGNGRDFNATTSYINCGSGPNILSSNPRTVTVISKSESAGETSNGGFFDSGARTTLNEFSLRHHPDADKILMQFWTQDIGFIVSDWQNKYHQYAIKYNGTTATGYYDGGVMASGDVTLNTLAGDFKIGIYGDLVYDGVIDEVRVSNIARSDAWIKAEYESLLGNMVSMGETTSVTMPDPVGVAKVYGVTFDPAVSSVGTRTDDAVGLSYTVNASTINSDFDSAEIYSEITEETDAYGNKFIKIPKFYIRKSKNGTKWTYQISKEKKNYDYYLPACFNQGGSEQDYILVGKYEGYVNGDKLESKSGKQPRSQLTIASFRTYAKNNGAGYGLIDIHTIDVIQTLFLIEFATIDSQAIMKGFTYLNSAVINTGATDSVTTSSGSPVSNSDGVHAMKYRGIENFWGNIMSFIDGINYNNTEIYVSKNAATYQADKFDGDYSALGYAPANNGDLLQEKVEALGFDIGNSFAQFPSVVGSGNYKDLYTYSSGWRVAAHGGCWSHLSIDDPGIFYWYAVLSSNSSNASIGARLIKYQ